MNYLTFWKMRRLIFDSIGQRPSRAGIVPDWGRVVGWAASGYEYILASVIGCAGAFFD